MNEIIGNRKFYEVRGLILSIALLYAWDPALAAVSYRPIQNLRQYFFDQYFQPLLTIQLEKITGVIIIDSFEYEGSPLNHGWHIDAPAYPIDFPLWGMTTSSGSLSTVFDYKRANRLLELVNHSPKPCQSFRKYMLSYLIEADIPPEYSVLSLEMKVPVSEHFVSYEVIAILNGGVIEVHMIPEYKEDGGVNCPVALPEDTTYINPYLIPFDRAADPTCVEVKIDREDLDGSWHLIKVDLAQVLANVGGNFETLTSIVLRGNEFRL
ncbi:MAG: hypothetical protein ACMUIP_07120 [bacterium]